MIITNCFVFWVLIFTHFLWNADGLSWFGSTFECLGFNRCYDDQIHCDDYVDCNIDCNGPNACQYAVVNCPLGAACNVNCGGNYDACKNAIFLATRSSSFSMHCQSQDEGCDESVIYCPDNGYSGPKTCQISGLNAVNVVKGLTIYAVEGLNDVNVTGTQVHGSWLYCKHDFSSSCKLPEVAPFNQCTNTDQTCETYLEPTRSPTKQPTSHPTPLPTLYPTRLPTNSPTLKPTDLLTTNRPSTSPTNIPTYYEITTERPTMAPTQRPTRDPTSRPTNPPTPRPTERPTPRPTARPTMRPTARPTDRPTMNDNQYTTTEDGDRLIIDNSIHGEDPNLTGDPNTDTNGDNNNNAASTINDSSKLNPLYYVITALLTSICYISCSLFCWVHYNHKYTKKIIELKKSENLSPNAARIVMVTDDAETDGIQMLQNDQCRYASASVASAATAPTTHSHDTETNAPTTSKDSDTRSNTTGSSSCSDSHESSYDDDDDNDSNETDDDDEFDEEFKEVDYETNANEKTAEKEEYEEEEQCERRKKLTTDSTDIDNTTIHDDASVMQYGENIENIQMFEGPQETHTLQMSNLSDLQLKNSGILLMDYPNEVEYITGGDLEDGQYVYTWQQQEIIEENDDPNQPLQTWQEWPQSGIITMGGNNASQQHTWQQFPLNHQHQVSPPEAYQQMAMQSISLDPSVSQMKDSHNNNAHAMQTWQQWPPPPPPGPTATDA